MSLTVTKNRDMALTKEQKAAILEDVLNQLQGANSVYLTNYSGLSVAESNELRGKFKGSNIEYRVVKNTLLKKAMDSIGGFEDLYDKLDGPTAVAFSTEPAAPARVIKDFSEASSKDLPELKGAYIDGAIYGADSLDVLASLKSKDELIGDIIGLLMSPMTNVIGALQSPGSTLVGALNTIAEGKEES